MFVLCLLFFMCYIWIHACLLKSRPFAMFLFVFPLWVCCLLVFGANCLFGCIRPLWWLVWKHIFVIFGLLATCFSPLFLALHVRVSHIRLSMCHITFLALLLCDNMLGFLYACFVPSYLAFFICLNLYILVYLFMNVSLYVCLCLQA